MTFCKHCNQTKPNAYFLNIKGNYNRNGFCNLCTEKHNSSRPMEAIVALDRAAFVALKKLHPGYKSPRHDMAWGHARKYLENLNAE